MGGVLASHSGTFATVTHTITSAESTLPCDAIVLVTNRIPNDVRYHKLKPALVDGKLKSLRPIGDAEARILLRRLSSPVTSPRVNLMKSLIPMKPHLSLNVNYFNGLI